MLDDDAVTDQIIASKLKICAAPKPNTTGHNGVVLPITVAEVNRLLKDPTLTGLFRTSIHVTQGMQDQI